MIFPGAGFDKSVKYRLNSQAWWKPTIAWMAVRKPISDSIAVFP
jgi:hypothetical protein